MRHPFGSQKLNIHFRDWYSVIWTMDGFIVIGDFFFSSYLVTILNFVTLVSCLLHFWD